MKYKILNVAKPSLPHKKDFLNSLNIIFKNHHLTNNGPLVKKLKTELEKKLGVKNLLLVNNATLGLEIAIKTFNPKKKIATTPFTYVSTLNAIRWLGFGEKFFEIIGKENAAFGVRSASIRMGYFDGRMTNIMDEDKIKSFKMSIGNRRLGTSEDLIEAINFIIDNKYSNGGTIELTGGISFN